MYKAFIGKIKTEPHPNPKYTKVQIGYIYGCTCLVSVETEDETFGVFFPYDGKFNEEFALKNNLLKYHPSTGERLNGYIDSNCRIYAIRLTGVRSEGVFIPLKGFEYLGEDFISFLKENEGKAWDGKFGDKVIVEKYFSPKTIRAMRDRKTSARRTVETFAKHFDAEHYFRNRDMVKENSVVWVTEKLHGTSGRYGNVIVEEEIPHKFSKIPFIGKFFKPTVKKEYQKLIGTRNVIVTNPDGGFYGNDVFRYDVFESFKDFLEPGEVVYGEIVGWIDQNKKIMASHNVSALGKGGVDKNVVKSFKDKYGENVDYIYGQSPGHCKFYVYRITKVNEYGHAFDLPFAQVQRRAKELGLETVPVLFGPIVINKFFTVDQLDSIVYTVWRGESVVDANTMKEGCVVRLENEKGVSDLKAKNFEFCLMEGILKDAGDLDIEEAS